MSNAKHSHLANGSHTGLWQKQKWPLQRLLTHHNWEFHRILLAWCFMFSMDLSMPTNISLLFSTSSHFFQICSPKQKSIPIQMCFKRNKNWYSLKSSPRYETQVCAPWGPHAGRCAGRCQLPLACILLTYVCNNPACQIPGLQKDTQDAATEYLYGVQIM